MGHFSCTCGISKLPILSSSVVLQIIIPTQTYDSSNSNKFFSSNSLFEPLFLPIRGIYNGYGTLENVEQDINVTILENYFGTNIENILDIIFNTNSDFKFEKEDKNKEKIVSMLKQAKPMFFIQEIYDKISNSFYEEYIGMLPIEERIKEHPVNFYDLHKLGFKLINKDKLLFEKNDIIVKLNKYSVDIDYNATNVLKRTVSKKSINSLKDFIKIYNDIDKKNILDISIFSQDNLILNSLKNILVELQIKNDFETTTNDEKLKNTQQSHQDLVIYFNNLFDNNNFLPDIYLSEIIKLLHSYIREAKEEPFLELINIFDKFKEFESNMVALNTIYLPTFYGYQDGAMEAHKFLNEEIKTYVDSKTDE